MKKIFIPGVLCVMFAACKDRYDIPLKDSDKTFLVVEGNLNVGPDSTTITLSRSVKVNELATVKVVPGAKLTVENKNGGIVSLNEMPGGRYGNKLNLVSGNEYRLRIKTSDRKEYVSDYVVAKTTPPIDSVTWKKDNQDLIIQANTHDPSNNTRYYKWDFDETWEINSFFYSDYQWVGGTTIIPSPGYHFQCWKYGHSTSINLGSSSQLNEDRISDVAITRIPQGSEKIGVRYSILLKQLSLTKDAYDYFQVMKKNTESLGSIFDPQPSEMKGNIQCISHPEEGVIGFITASSSSEKRIFITSQQAGWTYSMACGDYVRVPNNADSIRQWVPHYLPWAAEESAPSVITLYYMAPGACVDCTLRGGALNMPSYW